MSDLTRHGLKTGIKPGFYAFSQKHKTQMQTENLANNSHKQFYVPLNTNQNKLYTYPDLLKENPLLRKFLNSESTAYFLDKTFVHTHVPFF